MAATLIFIAGFSLGQGSVCWILLAEIVPSRIRAQAFSVFTAVNWVSNLFVGLFTLTAINAMGEWLLPEVSSSSSEAGDGNDVSPSSKDQQKAGVAGLYTIFAILSVVAIAFIYFFVPETTGKSLEELEGAGGDRASRPSFHLGHLGHDEDGQDVRETLLRSDDGGGEGSVVGDGEDACRVAL